jgi:hypothetical protein
MRLIQLSHPDHGRRIAKVNGSQLTLIDSQYPTNYDLFSKIILEGHLPEAFIPTLLTNDQLSYDEIYEGATSWKILPSFDHPQHPMLCMLSGTGLTHKASAENRQKMHEQVSEGENVTDSMEMYLWGEEGGKPGSGNIGVQPEWFYKGNGNALKGINDLLNVPPYADDGGEEPEIAGVYVISSVGTPHRIGFTMANEFSDHVMEKKNYLYLAPSKLRTCSIGPELVLDSRFDDIPGTVSVSRNGNELWSKKIKSGEKNMAHSLENLEYHHFKYEQHCIPGTVHIHFFGADAFSFGDNIQLQNGDVMNVSFEGFGRPLRNPIKISDEPEELVEIHTYD